MQDTLSVTIYKKTLQKCVIAAHLFNLRNSRLTILTIPKCPNKSVLSGIIVIPDIVRLTFYKL